MDKADDEVVGSSFKVRRADKEAFGEVCREIGISSSSALSVFVKAFIANRGFPFDVVSRRSGGDQQPEAGDVHSGE